METAGSKVVQNNSFGGGMVHFDVVIVGAGMGGLMAGALLAQRGRRVLVVEAADRIGGYQCRLESGDFSIEPHFHFLQDAGPGRPVRRLLDELGIGLEWERVDPLVEFTFPDRRFTVPVERADFIDMLKRNFPTEISGIERLFATTKAIHQAARRLPALAPVLVRHGGDTVDDLTSRFIADPALKTVAGGWAAYFGYGTDQISGLAIATFTEACFDGGVMHPRDGITSLADALRTSIESNSGVVSLASSVQRIDVAAGRVTGVALTNGDRIEAPMVISTLDASTTFGKLIAGDSPAAALVQRLDTVDRFRSPFSVFLAVRADALRLDGRSPVQVVFPGYDTSDQDRAQLAGEVERAPVSLGIPTLVNPQLAPAGHHIVVLYTFLVRERIEMLLANESQARALAHRLVRTAERGLSGLERGAVAMITSTSAMRGIYTPMTGGALGWAPTPAVLTGGKVAARALRNPLIAAVGAAAARIAPDFVARCAARTSVPGPTTPVLGLFLAGQWTRNGAGINNVFASACDAVAAVESATA
jgi:phytoene dehydrogenase-like protein